jgi:hypothetical protein
MIARASACLLAGVLLAGCNRAGWDWGGRWSPKMATSSGGSSPGEAPGGEVSPVIAADAPVAKTKESAPPPAVPHPPPAREGKYEARLDGELRRAGVDRIAISTGTPYVQSLIRFFRMRERKR